MVSPKIALVAAPSTEICSIESTTISRISFIETPLGGRFPRQPTTRAGPSKAENATEEEESVEAQVDVVRLASKFLEGESKHGRYFDPPKKRFVTIAKREHNEQYDSPHRISAFLGEKNWSWRKVTDLINLKENLHPSVLKTLRADRHSDHKTSLGQQASAGLDRLEDKKALGALLPLRRGGEALIPISTSPAFQRFRSEVSDGSR